jgi:hypothetical protein
MVQIIYTVVFPVKRLNNRTQELYYIFTFWPSLNSMSVVFTRSRFTAFIPTKKYVIVMAMVPVCTLIYTCI